MNLFKYKYMAHKLVNYIFYIVVFVLGFLFGLGLKRIDFNKIIPKILMIDNVSATVLYEDDDLTVDESFILDQFNTVSGFSLEDNLNIACTVRYGDSHLRLNCAAFNNSYDLDLINHPLTKTSFSNVYSNSIRDRRENGSEYRYEFDYNLDTKKFYVSPHYTNSGYFYLYLNTNNSYAISTSPFTSNRYSRGYSTFDVYSSDGVTLYNPKLDFDSFGNLEFNDNLFENNPLFKKECVKNYDTFSITTDFWMGEEDNKYYQGDDFLIFPHGVIGLNVYSYDNQSNGNYKEIDKNGLYGNNYWFNSKENINKYFDSKIPGDLLFIGNYSNKLPNSSETNSNAYFNRYKYYDYTFYPFKIDLKGDKMEFNIFEFKSPGVKYIDSDDINYPDEYCFYIKSRYNVNILDRDEFGDVYGTIVTPNGNVDINISHNQDSMNNVGIFSTITNFMSRIRDSVHFINENIYDFYNSMPLIVRMFIISCLGLFIVKFIIDMVVK